MTGNPKSKHTRYDIEERLSLVRVNIENLRSSGFGLGEIHNAEEINRLHTEEITLLKALDALDLDPPGAQQHNPER